MGRTQNKMQFNILFLSIILSTTDANPIKRNIQVDDLQTAGSSYSHQYYDWGGNKPGGYSFGITGNGLIEDSYGYEPIRQNTINSYPDGYETGLGGYGGYGGNGGLNSYYGYNNPYYQEANHLGFGYYKKFENGNIYSNGVTPNLVVGYRGYSRR